MYIYFLYSVVFINLYLFFYIYEMPHRHKHSTPSIPDEDNVIEGEKSFSSNEERNQLSDNDDNQSFQSSDHLPITLPTVTRVNNKDINIVPLSTTSSTTPSSEIIYPCQLQITSLRCRGIQPDSTAKLAIGLSLRCSSSNTTINTTTNSKPNLNKSIRNGKSGGENGSTNASIIDDQDISSSSITNNNVRKEKWESRPQPIIAAINWNKNEDLVTLGNKVSVLEAEGLFIDFIRIEKSSSSSSNSTSSSKNLSSTPNNRRSSSTNSNNTKSIVRKILGSGKINLDDIRNPNGEGGWSGWTSIYHSKNHSLIGEVYVQLSLIGTLPPTIPTNNGTSNNTNDVDNISSSEYDGPTPNTLRITIHECRSLISLSDTNITTSSSTSTNASNTTASTTANNTVSKLNPSVKVTVGSMELRTAMKSNTANPLFEETFVFPLTNRSLSSVLVTIENAGVIRTQSIAKLEFEPIDLSPIRGRKMRRWLPLMNSTGMTDRPRGEIELTLGWEHTPYGPNYINPNKTTSSSTLSPIPRRLTPKQVAELDGVGTEALNDSTLSVGRNPSKGSMFGMGKKPTPAYVPNKTNTISADENDDELMQVPEPSLDGISAGVVDNENDKEAMNATLKAREEAEKRQLEEAAALANSVMKEGDYTISVHIIEARMLKPEDPSGTSDPVVYVDVLGQKQHTRIIYKRNTCVWDQTLIFNLSKMAISDLEQGTIKVSVFDADTFSANDLIGAYVLDIASVYAMPHHEVYRAWVGITDESSEVDRGIQGLLRISVTIMGPGDVPFIHPPSDANDEEGGENNDIMDTLLMPPSVERKLKFLVLSMYCADNLPCMDDSIVGLGGIDGFAKVQFAGLVAKTKWVSAKGNNNLSLEWVYELWIPVLVPTMNDMIEISIWDYDRLKENDRVGTVQLHFRDIDKSAIVPTWFPIYGAPDGVETGAVKNRMNKYPRFASNYRGRVLLAARLETDDGNEIEKVHTKVISRLPVEFMPRMDKYRVRALIIMGDEIPAFASTAAGIFSFLGSDVGIMISLGGRTVYTHRVRPERGTTRWNSLVEFDVMLPAQKRQQLTNDDDDDAADGENNKPIALPSPKGTSDKNNDIDSSAQSNSSPDDIQQYDRWDGFSSPLPDTFIYLYRGEPTKGRMWHQRVCFARLNTAELIQKGFAGSAPYWQPLVEDQAINAIGDDEKTGTVLVRIGIEALGDATPPFISGSINNVLEDADNGFSSNYNSKRDEASKPLLHRDSAASLINANGTSRDDITSAITASADEWRQELLDASALIPYELRIHAYRGEDLPAADDDGSLDAYLRISLNGTTKRTGICYKSTNPAWYETISLPAMLPALRLAPQVRIQLWDHDDITADDFVSEMRFNLSRPECILSSPNNLPMELPSPTWFELGRFESKATNMDDRGAHIHHGKVLLSLQLIRKDNPNQIVRQIPPTIIPASKDYYLELIILGLRSMEHYNGLPLFLPYIEFDLGDRSKTGKVKRTLKSRSPTSTDPNFCERLILPASIPVNSLFTGVVNVVVRDSRLAGLSTPVVGTGSIKLRDKIPWSPTFRPSRGIPLLSMEHPGYNTKNERQSPDNDHQDNDDELNEADEPTEEASLLNKNSKTSKPEHISITIDNDKNNRKDRVRKMSTHRAKDDNDTNNNNVYDDFTAIDMNTQNDDQDEVDNSNNNQEIEMVNLSKKKKNKKHKKKHSKKYRDDDNGGNNQDDKDNVEGSGTGLLSTENDTTSVNNNNNNEEENSNGNTDIVLAKGSKYPPMINEWGMDEAQYLQTMDGSTEVEDEEAALYMAGRRVYSTGLEEVFTSTPFERFPIMRGQRVGRGRNPLTLGLTQLEDNTHVCGTLKGIVRVIRSADEPPAFDLSLLKHAHPYIIRVYVLNGINLTPHDANGTSDPYLVVRLGGNIISGRSEYKSKTVNPEFYKMFELKAMLPGPSVLSVEAWDYDAISGDDFIGGTKIDLEDRWFEPAWQALGKDYETFTRLRPKPVETRTLWCPKSTAPQGSVRLWIDILTPALASRYPPVKIAPPPPQEYEIRCIVWGTRNVKGEENGGAGSDYFIRAQFHGDKEEETDTHWRCKDGNASFNWRMKFRTTLPTKYPHLTIQLYDRDIVKYNDLISEAVLDLSKPLRRAAKLKEPIEVFDTDPDVVGPKIWKIVRRQQKRLARRKAKAEAAALAAEKVAADGTAPVVPKAAWINEGTTISANDDPNRANTEKSGESSKNLLKHMKKKKHKNENKDGNDGKNDAPPPSEAVAEAPAPSANPVASLLTASPLGAVVAATPMGKLAATAGVLPTASPTTGGSAEETIDHVRKSVGTVEYVVRPRHAQYLPMYKVEYESGDMNYELVGEVLISVEILPKDMAERFPVGVGRKDPNQYPVLPEPIGRMRLNLNPLSLLTHIMGTKACIAMVVSTVASVGTAGLVFGAPFVDSMIGWMTGLSGTAQIAIWSTIGVMILGMCICCCVSNNCRKQAATREEVDIFGSAADILNGEGAWDASAIGGDTGIDGDDIEDSDEEEDDEKDDDGGSQSK